VCAAPYGIESFDDVLEPLWKGIRLLRGKVRPLCPLRQLRHVMLGLRRHAVLCLLRWPLYVLNSS